MPPRPAATHVDDLAAIAGGLVLFAAERAAAAGHEELVFLTREGTFLQKAFEVLQRAGAAPQGIGGRLLETSRLATFGASVRSPGLDEWMRVWRQYRRQSPHAFLTSLGLDPADYADLLGRHGLDRSAVVERPWRHTAFRAFVDDRDFLGRVGPALAERRSRLLGHLDAAGLLARPRWCLVDVGWRGTMQDNFAHLLPDHIIDGVYLGLQRYLNPQPPRGAKDAFAIDLNREPGGRGVAAALRFVPALELFLGAGEGSVHGYAAGPSFAALRQDDPASAESFRRHIEPLQQEVLDQLARRPPDPGPEARREAARSAMARLLLTPSRTVASLYFRCTLDERFGDGRSERKGRSAGALVRSVVGGEGAVAFLRETGWPQGWLMEAGLGRLVTPFNWLLARHDARDGARPGPDAPLKVLLVTGRSDHGGGPEHLLQLLEAFGPGVEPVVAAPSEGVFASKFRARVGADAFIPIAPRRFSPLDVVRLVREIRRRGVDVVHGHGTAAGLLTRLSARLAGVPCVHTFHGVSLGISPRSRLLRGIERLLGRWTTRGVAVSPGEADQIRALGLFDPARLATVCNGIAIDEPCLRPARPPGTPLRVVSFLRANRQKNPELAFEAVRLAARAGRTLKVDFYGEGMPDFAAGLGGMASLPPPSTLRVHPPTDAPKAALAAADVYLSTSRWEGLPYALLEAAAAGAVVVATDVVGNRDVVRHEQTGLLTDEASAQATANALSRLASDPALVERLREGAFHLVRDRFDRTRTAVQVLELYRACLDEKHS